MKKPNTSYKSVRRYFLSVSFTIWVFIIWAGELLLPLQQLVFDGSCDKLYTFRATVEESLIRSVCAVEFFSFSKFLKSIRSRANKAAQIKQSTPRE